MFKLKNVRAMFGLLMSSDGSSSSEHAASVVQYSLSVVHFVICHTRYSSIDVQNGTSHLTIINGILFFVLFSLKCFNKML
jgi:hypothetical protein